jgi:hypothetical protein
VDEHIFEFDYLKRYLDTAKYFHEVAFERWNVWLGAEPEFGLSEACKKEYDDLIAGAGRARGDAGKGLRVMRQSRTT